MAHPHAYQASSRGRRLGSWNPPRRSPTDTVTAELETLRTRSRDLTRNNEYSQRALKVHVSQAVGKGIKPRANTPYKEFNDQLMDLWGDYADYANYNGGSIYALQALVERAYLESGEVFVRIIRYKNNKAIPVPLQFQVLEADFCPTGHRSPSYNLSNGNEVKDGIEIDKNGRVVAYHFYKKHPLESFNNDGTMQRVPASDVIHVFEELRPGQLRGEPSGVQSFVRSRTFDSYSDAELHRKEGRAAFTGTIEKNQQEQDFLYDPITGESLQRDEQDVPMLDIEPGTFHNLLPGEKLNLFDGDPNGNGYSDFQKIQLLSVSAGYNVPYQLMSNDYQGVNDRIWRAVMNQFHRELEQTVQNVIIDIFCKRVWQEFVNRCIIVGLVLRPPQSNNFDYLRCKHRPHAWSHIHPLQDVQAQALEVEKGFKSRQQVIDERGDFNVYDTDEQRREDLEREKSMGIYQEQKDAKEIIQTK